MSDRSDEFNQRLDRVHAAIWATMGPDAVQAAIGRGTSRDGMVEVGYLDSDPLHELRIDPRATRMPASALAASIEEAALRAREDFAGRNAEAPSSQETRDEVLSFAREVGRDPDAMIAAMRRRFETG